MIGPEVFYFITSWISLAEVHVQRYSQTSVGTSVRPVRLCTTILMMFGSRDVRKSEVEL